MMMRIRCIRIDPSRPEIKIRVKTEFPSFIF